MRKLHQVTLLGLALGLLAAPLAAAGPEGPLCTAGVSSGPGLAVGQAVPADGVASPVEPVAGIATTPEPQPLAGPIGPAPQQCGNVVCPFGTRCCNPLCSACTPPGVECTLGDCGHGPSS